MVLLTEINAKAIFFKKNLFYVACNHHIGTVKYRSKRVGILH